MAIDACRGHACWELLSAREPARGGSRVWQHVQVARSDWLPPALSCRFVLQLAALRQQIAGLRAENLALRTALGGDKEAAGVIAAAGRGAQVRVYVLGPVLSSESRPP